MQASASATTIIVKHAHNFWLARGFLAWLLIAALETLHGIARTLWLVPLLGDQLAQQLAILSAIVIVFVVAMLAIGWIDARGGGRKLIVGLQWLVLMVGFDILLGRSLGYSWERILGDFNPLAGGFLGLGMATMLIAPWLAGRLRKLP
jgi:hypothetical protein